ncbi:MAG: septum formation protein Maf [Bacteroidales bacterium]|nr:septum formation protein Maf [Bacteroidales bacterium]
MSSLYNNIDDFDIILASRSSRRHALLRQLDIKFRVSALDTKETFPSDMPVEKVAEYISQQKINDFPLKKMRDHTIIITADTIVAVDQLILGKPSDEKEAFEMLQMLSGRTHQVITGVSIKSIHHQKSFSASTKVKFKELTDQEIHYYIENYQPFDKAGAYGIQEWIGKVGVEWIEGSFYNVMGLPIQKLYIELCNFTA